MNSRRANEPALLRTVWKPVLIRGIICIIFALLPIFYTRLGEQMMGWWAGFFFVIFAISNLNIVRVVNDSNIRLSEREERFKKLIEFVPAILLIIAGVVIFFTASPVILGILGSLTLLFSGIGEIGMGNIYRGAYPLWRDWVITGLTQIFAGIILVFFIPAGAQALLGVLASAMVIVGVVFILAALSFRHDATKAVH